MKNLVAAVLLLLSTLAFSQDYKSKFSKSVCECVNKLDATNKTKKEMSAQFGLCAFKNANPYKKELKRDFDIDLVADISNEKKMTDFGVQVGLLMLNDCPEVLIAMNKDSEETETVSDESSYLLLSGTVKKIEKENFVVFHIVGENNNLTKFYWVSNIESNLDLPKEYNSLLNKKVNISYYTTEIFDAKINDYRNLNVISSLKTE
ncbi:hypothetical protein NZ698_07275 [Chryseobacterium sp. PBS4-4]|uniref:Uncharacterized protein n=1 Tax=Chryseobacterium edaphi TaxID=2976532 RepID=A0ABT2W4V5_9FLAO|nr:hypothetical protein [Chryseobacterium edaphi]MCU7616994.1 hypothetical protein [Chryseobacterium edaphi]